MGRKRRIEGQTERAAIGPRASALPALPSGDRLYIYHTVQGALTSTFPSLTITLHHSLYCSKRRGKTQEARKLLTATHTPSISPSQTAPTL